MHAAPVKPTTDNEVGTDEFLDVPHVCEALLRAGKPACPGEAKVIVRFKAHGCGRDGKGVLLCMDCRNWIAKHEVGCGYCDQPRPDGQLIIVSSVAL
jgi:hypothetical protein